MTQIPKIFNHQRVLALQPKNRYQSGEDFSLWQQKTKARLSELLGMDSFTRPADDRFQIEWSRPHPVGKEVRLTVQTEEGYQAVAHLLIPTGAEEKGKNPLVICLQGHSTGMHISLGVEKYDEDAETIAGGRDFAVQAAKESYLALAVEQRNFGECGGKGEKGPDCYQSSMTAILSGRTTVGERVWDISRILDAMLREMPDLIDEKKIVCTGNSGGGTTTFYAACMEDRISYAMPCCAMCTYGDSIAAMYHCACNFIPNIALEYDMGDLTGLIAPRPFVILCGKDDPIFPVSGVEKTFAQTKALYQAAGAEENCTVLVGNGGHQYYPELAWPKLKELFAKG